MKMQAALIGIKKNDFNGTIDGEKIVSDSTSFFIAQDLPTTTGKAKGQATMEYKYGKADEFDKWSKMPLPVQVDVELSVETTGKNIMRVVLASIKPSESQPVRKAA